MEPAASLPPHIPSRRTAAGKKFDSGDIAHQPDDTAAGFLRFLAVFLDVGQNHLMYPALARFGCPLVASKQISAFARVQ